jgi:hypothetical protein
VRDSDPAKRRGGLTRLGVAIATEGKTMVSRPCAQSCWLLVPSFLVVMQESWAWDFWSKELQALVLSALSDERESVRLAAVHVVRKVIRGVSSDTVSTSELASLLKALLEQLLERVGVHPFAEESEEVRLGLVEALGEAFVAFSSKEGMEEVAAECLEGAGRVLARMTADPNPSAKLAACETLDGLCRLCPGYVHRVLMSLVKPLLVHMQHQRAEVRTRALESLVLILPLGGDSLEDCMTGHVLPVLEKLLDDRVGSFREALARSVASLLESLPLTPHPGDTAELIVAKLIMILYSEAADEGEGVCAAAGEALERAASSDRWSALPREFESLNDDLVFPPPWDSDPPSVAVQAFARQFLDRCIPRVLESMGDWTAPRRVVGAAALRSVVCLAQGGVSAHLDAIVTALLSASRDEDTRVRTLAADTGAILGGVAPPDALVGCLLPQVGGKAVGGASIDSGYRSSALAVLNDAISGMDEGQARPLVPTIARALADPTLLELEPKDLATRLLFCVNSVMEVGGDACTGVRADLGHTLLGLHRLGLSAAVKTGATETTKLLASMCGLTEWTSVFQEAVSSVMAEAEASGGKWEGSSPSRWKLETIGYVCPSLLAPHVPSLLRVLGGALDPARSPEVRVSAFATLRAVIDAASLPGEEVEDETSAAVFESASTVSTHVQPDKPAKKASATTTKKKTKKSGKGSKGSNLASFVSDLDALVMGTNPAAAAAVSIAAAHGSSSDIAAAAGDAELAALLEGTTAPVAVAPKTKKGGAGKKRHLDGAVAGAIRGANARAAATAALKALKEQEASVLGEEFVAPIVLEGKDDVSAKEAARAALRALRRGAAASSSASAAVAERGSLTDLQGDWPAPHNYSPELHRALAALAVPLLLEIVEPNMQWRVGRVASTVRKVATSAALGVWRGGFLVADDDAMRCFRAMLPSTKSCMSDDVASTRSMACALMSSMLKRLAGSLDGELARALQEDLVKRLDDADDAVRLRACSLLSSFSRCAPAADLRGSPCQWSVDALLIHADDPNPSMATAAASAIEPWVSVDPEYVLRACRECRTKHRSPEVCDRLASMAAALCPSDSSS